MRKNQNLKAYVRKAVIEHITENMYSIVIHTEQDVIEYVNNIFYREMVKYNNMYKQGKISRYSLFKEWLFGLCFISPIGEDLTPFTNYKDYMSQEHDVVYRLMQLYYIYNDKEFNKIIAK